MDWVPKAVVCLIVIGLGLLWIFYTDQLADYSIRRLQSKGYRQMLRFSGGLVLVGLVLAGAFATGYLR